MRSIAGEEGADHRKSDVAATGTAKPPRLAVPARPHMPEPVAAWLEKNLKLTTCFLEYGAGGSTRLAATLGVPIIYSVESDPAFANAVEAAVAAQKTKSQCTVIRADIGRTGEWGYPLGFEAFHRWPNYSIAPWDLLRKKAASPDLLLIDGRFRVACLLASLLEARPGTPILFDDYFERPSHYGVVEKLLRPVEHVDRSAIFRVPEKLPIRAVARALARYACVPM